MTSAGAASSRYGSDEPEALICVPLLDRGRVLGALNLYRLGADANFAHEDFELACRFGDAAALALAQAELRAHLAEEARRSSAVGVPSTIAPMSGRSREHGERSTGRGRGVATAAGISSYVRRWRSRWRQAW